MVSLLETDDFLGYSTAAINHYDSIERYSMEQKNTYKILWLKKGNAKITFNGLHILLEENQCIFINKNTSLMLSSLQDFQLVYIQFNELIFFKNHDLNILIKNSNLFEEDKLFKKITLKQKSIPIIEYYFELLTGLQFKVKTTLNNLLAQNILQQIILLSISLYGKVISNFNQSKKDLCTERTLDLLNKNVIEFVKSERNVKFYCDRIGIDYTILNRICLAEYGISIKNYLDLKCMYQIKYQLETSSMSIKELSVYFNFSDVSNFLRFFKRLNGITVSQYRSKISLRPALQKKVFKEEA